MTKNEMFRKLNERFPDIVERTITLWGTPELDVYLLDTLSDLAVKPLPGATAETSAILSGLKFEHDREYPHFVAEGNAEALKRLDENPDFQVVSEKFAHISRRVRSAWGHASFPVYLDSLFNDNRGGKRQGLPEAVVSALFHLNELHELEYPQFVRKISDIWTANNNY